jgi:GntR family transcriptional regulator
MWRRSSRQNGGPLYNRIAAELRDGIEAGTLAPHEPLPSERRLSDELGVSRMTARQALALLEREGYVYRRRALGTFVAEPRISVRAGGLSAELVRVGRKPGAVLLHSEAATPTRLVADALELAPGEEVLVTQRLRSADGTPLAVETSYWPRSRCPKLLEPTTDGSLWAFVREEHGIVATETDARLEAISLDQATAGQLDVSVGAPGFLLTRRTFDADGRCFEFARDVYRGDRSEFRMRVVVDELDSQPALLQEHSSELA